MINKESAVKFVPSLMKYHQLALHLLAHDWSKYHCNLGTWVFPMSTKMYHWRFSNKLLFIDDDDGYKARDCLHPNICDFKVLSTSIHWYRHIDCPSTENSSYHDEIKIYMEYCTEHLH